MSHYDVKAGLEKIEGFSVIGVSVITDNDKGAEEINALWEEFFQKQIGQKIKNRVDDVIYAVYSDYEGDHTRPYRYTIGYRIKDGNNNFYNNLNDSLHHVQVKGADYAMMSAAGQQPKALIETWTAIWQSDLDRRFETDFEVYGKRFFEEGVHEVLVAIGVNL